MDHLHHMNQHVVSAMLDDGILPEYLFHPKFQRDKRLKKVSFNFSQTSKEEFWSKFRITKDDIPGLQSALGIPEKMRFSNRITENGLNALLWVLQLGLLIFKGRRVTEHYI